jgi:hypothetical protein
MAPFEALYGRRCQTPLSWSETGERKIFGLDLVVEAKDNIKVIQANLKAAQSRWKSYADQRRKPLQFQVEDFVYLRVSPTKGVQRFGIKGKLAPRYVEPFEILQVCGPVAYRIRLPSQLATIHDVFHISQLKKCIKVPTEIVEAHAIEIEPDLSYTEQPIQILDTKERVTRRKKIKMYKILWDHHTEEEATWETESYLQRIFSNLSSSQLPNLIVQFHFAPESRDEILFRGEGYDIQVIKFISTRFLCQICMLAIVYERQI